MASFTSKSLLLSIVFLVSVLSCKEMDAQKNFRPVCGYKMVMDQMERLHPGYKAAEQKSFEQINQQQNSRGGEVYRIPVVFHVIYNSDEQNIADEYLLDQLDIMNTAFRNTHAEVGNTRPVFAPLAGDAEIEFYLAPKDPQGNPSTGITRTHTEIETFGDISVIFGGFDIESFERIKYTEKGGYDGWPSDRYLNIWIADEGFDFLGIYIPAVLGLATPPIYPNLPDNWPEGATDGIKDGVFLQYQTIGRDNPYKDDLMGLVSQGRTAVHEVGHYLGLRHIDGDEACGTDGIGDTPVMDLSTQSADCPGSDVNTCENGLPDDMPDMWENYMDYSNDICQTMFTIGQVSHMRKVLSTQRDTLINGVLSVKGKEDLSMAVYPNPANKEVVLKDIPLYGNFLLFDKLGRIVIQYQHLNSSVIDVSYLKDGVYHLQYNSGDKLWRARIIVVH